MREFKTAARRSAPTIIEGAEPIEFKVDGDVFTAYPPSPGQMALLVSAQAEGRDVTTSMAAIIDFLDGLFDEEGRDMYRRRLMDRDDDFDFDTVNEIVEGLIEEWSGRPTKPSSASQRPRKSGGARSTVKRPSTA